MKILKSYSKFVMFGAIGAVILGTFFWKVENYLELIAIDQQENYTVQEKDDE